MTARIFTRGSIAAILAGFAGLPSTAWADTSTGYGQVSMIQFWDGHDGILIKTSQAMIDPSSCGRTDYYIVPDTLPHFDQIYALLLTAFSSHQQVLFLLDGCVQGIPAVHHVMMSQN